MNFGTGPTQHYSPPDIEVQQQIQRELEPGEHLRWCGRATASRLARRQIAPALISIPFLAFSIFWTVSALAMGAPFFFGLWGLMFIGIGVWLATTPLRAAASAKSTFYGITDRRVLIIEGTSTRRVRSWRGGEMSTLARAEHADGTGDVIFAREERRGNKGHRYWEEIGFFGIPDARYVEGLVQQLRG